MLKAPGLQGRQGRGPYAGALASEGQVLRPLMQAVWVPGMHVQEGLQHGLSYTLRLDWAPSQICCRSPTAGRSSCGRPFCFMGREGWRPRVQRMEPGWLWDLGKGT